MPRERSPNRDKAHEIYKDHEGNITNRKIAAMLQEDEKVIAVWKSRDKWNDVQQLSKSCTSKTRGGQPRNKNAVGHGAPAKNKNAEKFGFFSKHLPQETLSIIQDMPTNPLNIMWDQIMIAYAAIIRAQQIMYVRDKDDMSKTKIEEKRGNVSGEKWEVQQAWDKQGSFLQAQARAQSELRSMVKQYDELLHKNWELATEEQRARVDLLRDKIDSDKDKPINITFTKASEKHGG